MKKHFLWIATLALGLNACSDGAIDTDGDVAGNGPAESTETTAVYHAKLASVASSQSRVSVVPQSRATVTGPLTLFAEIENLSKDGGVQGFVQEEGGRLLSATCVYYEPVSKTYYVTYHMQGNNYNTNQTVETAGFIETFTLDENGVPTLGDVYTSENAAKEAFDFNHLYFDNLGEYNYNGSETGTRLVAVGHVAVPTSTGKTDTHAIIGKVTLGSTPSIDYSIVYTGDKILDANNGKSLGKEDAGDANCVIRKWGYYYLATRKGMAVLHAHEDRLFEPQNDLEGNLYFIKTPGSAKYLHHDRVVGSSHFTMLYLDKDTPEGFNGDTPSTAHVAKFSIDGGSGRPCGADGSKGGWDISDVNSFDITSWPELQSLPEVAPMDGKNVLFWGGNYIYYAALGKGGLYVFNPSFADPTWGNQVPAIVTFGENGRRPVNGVFVEEGDSNVTHAGTHGFIYVANGGCLTILDRWSLEKVAEFSSDLDEVASANFVTVTMSDHESTPGVPDRIITVAYGQAGVKVFKFVPPTY